MLNLLVEFSNS